VRVTREASMAKLFATEAAQQVIDAAVQLFGGLGVVRGVTVERLYREIRALRIYEGASEVLKLIIGGRALQAEAPPGARRGTAALSAAAELEAAAAVPRRSSARPAAGWHGLPGRGRGRHAGVRGPGGHVHRLDQRAQAVLGAGAR
jgi:hypothetical protein